MADPPILLNFLTSEIEATATTIEQKTRGTTIILINLMNPFPRILNKLSIKIVSLINESVRLCKKFCGMKYFILQHVCQIEMLVYG